MIIRSSSSSPFFSTITLVSSLYSLFPLCCTTTTTFFWSLGRVCVPDAGTGIRVRLGECTVTKLLVSSMFRLIPCVSEFVRRVVSASLSAYLRVESSRGRVPQWMYLFLVVDTHSVHAEGFVYAFLPFSSYLIRVLYTIIVIYVQ